MSEYLSLKLRRLSLVAMLLVVLLHANLPLPAKSPHWLIFMQQYCSAGLAWSAVPLFFLFSGYLFYQNVNSESGTGWYRNKIRSRIHSLLIPYLFWSGATLLVFLTAEQLPGIRNLFRTDYGGNILELLERWLFAPVPYQLWFVRDLLFWVLFSPLLLRIIQTRGIVPLLLLLTVLWCCRDKVAFLQVVGLLFFLTGGWLAQRYPWIPELRGRRLGPVMSAIWLSGIAVLKYLEIYADDHGRIVFFGLGRAWSIVGVIALWWGYDWLIPRLSPQWKICWNRLAACSFFLYLAHEPQLSMLKKFYFLVVSPSSLSLAVGYWLLWFGVIAICLAERGILLWMAPRVYRWISGGR